MKRQSQTNQAHKKLELIQDKSEIFCYHCGSKNYVKNGSSGVRKKYRCNDCQRSFLAGIKVKNKSSKGMQLGEDVWHANELDLHLLKKNVLPQALPNGTCRLPIVLGECPHANACLTCGHFGTTIEFLEQHKTQLKETKKIIKNAEEKGWVRQAEMNKRVENNLEKIINTLESGEKNIVSGAEE